MRQIRICCTSGGGALSSTSAIKAGSVEGITNFFTVISDSTVGNYSESAIYYPLVRMLTTDDMSSKCNVFLSGVLGAWEGSGQVTFTCQISTRGGLTIHGIMHPNYSTQDRVKLQVYSDSSYYYLYLYCISYYAVNFNVQYSTDCSEIDHTAVSDMSSYTCVDDNALASVGSLDDGTI